MRMFICGTVAVASLAVCAAALLAQDFKEHARNQFGTTPSIDTRELTDKATDLPTQQIDDLI